MGCKNNFKAKAGSTQSLTIKNKGEVDIAATINHIKADIMANGPVVAGFMVNADLELGTGMEGARKYQWDKTKGIYIQGEYNEELAKLYNKDPSFFDKPMGGHAVEIVGWGEEDIGGKHGVVKYWIVKNSWTDKWNEGGYWRHAMYPHNKACGLDIPIHEGGQLWGGCTAFQPDLSTGPAKGSTKRDNHAVFPGDDGKKKDKHEKKHGSSGGDKTWIWILIVVAVLTLLWYLYKKYGKKVFGKGRKRSRGRSSRK